VFSVHLFASLACTEVCLQLDHAGLIRAVTRQPFVIYASVCAVLIVVFGVLSAGPASKKYVFVDVGLCALFGAYHVASGARTAKLTSALEGGFTVLATKAVSTLLSLYWIEIFKDWLTYPVVAVCVSVVLHLLHSGTYTSSRYW
jgi:hypothetical protein